MLQAYGIPLKHVPLGTERGGDAKIIKEIIMQKDQETELLTFAIEIEVTEPKVMARVLEY
jgi:hypothetical protein